MTDSDPARPASDCPGVELRDVSKRYGTGSGQSVTAADNVSLTVEWGALIALNQITVIIVTHDPQIAARCDRLIRPRDGAVIDDIEIADGHTAYETIRRVDQLG